MPRYKLTIAYDGTDFCGWQKQFPHADAVPGALTKFRADDPPEMEFDEQPACLPLAEPSSAEPVPAEPSSVDAPAETRPRTELRTVQSVVERAVRLVVRQPVVVMGASRTDSGVHARGQVCAFTTFDAPSSGAEPIAANEPQTNHERFGGGWPLERGVDALVRALNSRLPSDVLVRNAEVAAPDFDPIGSATSKAYSYVIHNSRQRSLWDRRTSLHIWHELDAARMHDAAQMFVGEHDFAAFAAAGHGRQTTVRTVYSCAVRAEPVPATLPGEVGGQRITIDISGSGFLWNMVRIIAGTLVEAGKGDAAGGGHITPARIEEALRSGDRRLAGPTLPPHGLCLEWIKYGTKP